MDAQRSGPEPFIAPATFAEDHCAVQEGLVAAGERRLLRLTTGAANLGPGDVRVPPPTEAPDLFEWGACHGHHHFKHFAAYRLWTHGGFAAWAAVRAQEPDAPASALLAAHPELEDLLVTSHKQGFCLVDSDPVLVSPVFPKKYFFCTPGAGQGISPGWSDVYVSWLDGQWVDVTGTAPGTYVLEIELNPERVFVEDRYLDNAAAYVVFVD